MPNNSSSRKRVRLAEPDVSTSEDLTASIEVMQEHFTSMYKLISTMGRINHVAAYAIQEFSTQFAASLPAVIKQQLDSELLPLMTKDVPAQEETIKKDIKDITTDLGEFAMKFSQNEDALQDLQEQNAQLEAELALSKERQDKLRKNLTVKNRAIKKHELEIAKLQAEIAQLKKTNATIDDIESLPVDCAEASDLQFYANPDIVETIDELPELIANPPVEHVDTAGSSAQFITSEIEPRSQPLVFSLLQDEQAIIQQLILKQMELFKQDSAMLVHACHKYVDASRELRSLEFSVSAIADADDLANRHRILKEILNSYETGVQSKAQAIRNTIEMGAKSMVVQQKIAAFKAKLVVEQQAPTFRYR